MFLSSIRAQSGPSAAPPLTDADAPAPTDPYGHSKLAAEEALAEIGLDWVALRPVLVYGAGVKGNMAALLRLARSPYPLPLASLTGRRSLVSLESLAGAVVAALDAPAPIGRPLIVADPDPLTLPEMIAAMRSGLGRGPGLLPCPTPLIDLSPAAPPDGRRCSTASPARSSPAPMGWQPWAGSRCRRRATGSRPWRGPVARGSPERGEPAFGPMRCKTFGQRTPPLATMSSPVTQRASSEARNATTRRRYRPAGRRGPAASARRGRPPSPSR